MSDWGLGRTPGEGVFGLGSGRDGWLVDRTGQGWDEGWVLKSPSGVWLEEEGQSWVPDGRKRTGNRRDRGWEEGETR